MENQTLENYWNEIPIGSENAITYPEFVAIWNISEREVRKRLHALSIYDNGDDYVLVRSAASKGFYKTDNVEEIELYKNECLRKGRSNFAPVRKINRVLQTNTGQYSLENNLRVIREGLGMKQSESQLTNPCSQNTKIVSAFQLRSRLSQWLKFTDVSLWNF